MKFAKVKLDEIPKIRALLADDPREQSEYSLSYQIPYTSCQTIRFAVSDGCGIWCTGNTNANRRFCFPFGAGDKRKALQNLRDHCHEKRIPLVISSLSHNDCQFLTETLGPNFSMTPARGDFDYIYKTSDLADLSSPAYRVRRRHINYFLKSGTWSFEPITEDNLDDCLFITDVWWNSKVYSDVEVTESLENDYNATCQAIDSYFELGLTGGVLKKDEKSVAFGITEQLTPDMMLFAFVKALPEVRGAAPLRDIELARHCANGCSFINYASDEDSDGLRKFKTLLRPDHMLEKFIAREI